MLKLDEVEATFTLYEGDFVDGALFLHRAMVNELSEFGIIPPLFQIDHANPFPFFAWLAACVRLLGRHTDVLGECSAFVAMRNIVLAVHSLLEGNDGSISSTDLARLKSKSYAWPHVEDPAQVPKLPHDIGKNFVLGYFGPHGIKLASSHTFGM